MYLRVTWFYVCMFCYIAVLVLYSSSFMFLYWYVYFACWALTNFTLLLRKYFTMHGLQNVKNSFKQIKEYPFNSCKLDYGL
jgi:hypothetical protein